MYTLKSLLKLCLVVCPVFVFAQQNSVCEEKIIAAENSLQQGMIIPAKSIIQGVIDSCSLRKKNKIKALELLGRIHAEMHETEEANKTIKKILKKYPNYQPDNSRTEEDYLKLFSRFRVMPALNVGPYAEFVFPTFKTIGEANTILYEFNYNTPYESSKPGNIYGMRFELGAPTNTRLVFSPGYLSLFYNRKISNKTLPDYYTQLTETDNFMLLPLELNQHFQSRQFTAYAGIGYQRAILQKANAELGYSYPNFVYSNPPTGDYEVSRGQYFEQSSLIDVKNQRTSINMVKINGGITYKLSNFEFDMKYTLAQALNLSNSANLYIDQADMLKSNYIDSNFYMKYASVSISVKYMLIHYTTKRK